MTEEVRIKARKKALKQNNKMKSSENADILILFFLFLFLFKKEILWRKRYGLKYTQRIDKAPYVSIEKLFFFFCIKLSSIGKKWMFKCLAV